MKPPRRVFGQGVVGFVFENPFKILPKSFENLYKIYLKSIQNPLESGLELFLGPKRLPRDLQELPRSKKPENRDQNKPPPRPQVGGLLEA
eukprot:12425693-Karenia_brevis.AAC.1